MRAHGAGGTPLRKERQKKKGGDRSPPFPRRQRRGRAYARRRLIITSAPLASSRARIARPSSDRVGTCASDATANEVGSSAAAVDGLSVRIDDSLVPLPSASKKTVPWLEIVEPAVPVLTIAVMVIVTEPPLAAMVPFQCTVRVGTLATAVPELALALTRVRLAGRTSVNSSPGLSSCAVALGLESVTV